ncbi:MAG: hypothetical protein AAF702_29040 [Chloroflexota bacterium]
MTTPLSSPTITVKGPFWSADVDLISVTTPPALGPGELLIERFSQYEANQDPLHWVDTRPGNSFDEDQSLFKTFAQENQVVFGTDATANNIHSHYVAPGVLNWTNYLFTGRLFITESQAGIGVTFFSRYPEDEDSYYRLRITRSRQTFHIAPHPHGERTVDQAKFDSGITPQANTWYRFQIEIEDAGDRTNIRAKIWEERTPVPDEFQIETFDDSNDRLRSGTVGIWTGHAGEKYVDDLRVRTLNGADLLLPQLGAIVLDETFETYEASQDPASWQDTAANNHFTIDDSLFKTALVSEQKVFGTQSEQLNIHSHYVTPGALNWTNYTYSGRLFITDSQGGVGVTFFSRYPEDEDSYYRLRTTKSKQTFHIAPHPHGERTVDQAKFDSGITPQANTWYRFYIEVEDAADRTNIRAKIWVEGTPEPNAFQMDTFDDSADRLRSGTVGFWAGHTGEKYVDDLLVQPLLPRNAALRTLFVDRQPRSALGSQNVLIPGTLIALVSPRTVEIRPGGPGDATYQWRQGNALSFDRLTIEAIKEHLATGELSLLLLEANPANWPQQSGTLPDFTCINGEINLDLLQAQDDGDVNLYNALQLDINAELGERPGRTELLGRTTVHSSGATLFGGVHLPWMAQGEQVNAPFLLARLLSRNRAESANASYRLKAEVERLSPTEEASWIRAWRDLSSYLNPRNPLNGVGLVQRTAPLWSTLEITDPLNVPNLFWHIQQWADDPQVHFAPGEINLLLSDRDPYSQEQPPTTLATIAPTADIPLTVDEEDGGTLKIELIVGSGDESTDNFVKYAASPDVPPTGNDDHFMVETVELPDFELAFDAVETPRLLRNTLGRPTPEEIASAGDDLESEPILWGFSPLADGWAQLPVPNMTERIYFEALAKAQNDDQQENTEQDDSAQADGRMEEPTDGEPLSILQGAVGLGNSYPDTLAAHPNEQPWSLTITSLQFAEGLWTLSRRKDGDGFELTDIALRLEEPELVANGFFWLSSGRPTAGDALPDLENWVNGLRQIPLRSLSKLPASQPPIVRLDFDAVTLRLREPQEAPSAHLNKWSLHYRIHQETLEQLAEVKSLINETLEKVPPLVWRRHPTLPTIQALPMTQTLSPPNFPSASRQLAPYQLALDEPAWELGVLALEGSERSAAGQWPQILSASTPALEWQKHPDLPIAALTLPGLNFDPNTQLTASGLTDPMQTLLSPRYRFDLPYTDQLNALAQVPKEPRDPNEVSPLPDSPPPQVAKPLERATLEEHWSRLSEQASLASVAAADAFIQETTGQTTMQRLIEPLKWPVSVELDLTAYPGIIQINNAVEPLDDPLLLSNESALEGISGHFVDVAEQTDTIALTDIPEADAYSVRAGSMTSRLVGQGLRDQRGLLRQLTQHHADNQNLLFTEVTLNGDPTLGDDPDSNRNRTYHLMSFINAINLKNTDSDTWRFWLKDLPAEVDATGDVIARRFDRESILSPALHSLEPIEQNGSVAAINDPEALAREQNYRMGYEWRLGPSGAEGASGAIQPLRLNGLVFFPLTLERVEFEGEKIVQVDIVGRLQLPLAPASTAETELTGLSNAVRLIYKAPEPSTPIRAAEEEGSAAPALELSQIQAESPVVEWPLQLLDGEQTNAPRIEWGQVRLGENQEIIVGNADQRLPETAKCRFVLFGQPWCVPLGELTFAPGVNDADNNLSFDLVTSSVQFVETSQDRSLVPYDLHITLSRGAGLHEAVLRLQLRTGTVAQPSLEALIQFMLVPPLLANDEHEEGHDDDMPPPPSVILESANLFGQLAVETIDQPVQYVPESLQFVWQECKPIESTDSQSAIHFLPGMVLKETECPGFLALTFQAQHEDDGQDGNQAQIPALSLTSAFSETLLQTCWGTFSQSQIGEITPGEHLMEKRFGSSAGEIFIGYTAQWTRANSGSHAASNEPDLDGGLWDESFLLNGFLEVKNLISWPAQSNVQIDEERQILHLPAPSSDPLFSHTHHTIRVLLNQQQLPSKIVRRSDPQDAEDGEALPSSASSIFTLNAQHSWQFLAVVEHQLLGSKLTAPSDTDDELVPLPASIELVSERRWTALQEIRLLLPQTYAEFLEEEDAPIFDLVNGIAPRWSLYGHFQSAWASRLTASDGADSLAALSADMLLVEASAPHWIRNQSVEELLAEQIDFGNDDSDDSDDSDDVNEIDVSVPLFSGTTLQFLPTGSHSGILSSLQDYEPSAPSSPEWQLLTMPFLGRLQEASQDGLTTSASGEPDAGLARINHPLKVDPLLQLWRKSQGETLELSPLVYMLTSWSVEAEIALRFSEFDHVVSRTWARLDPLSLEENWFRLQNPPTEPPFGRVRSVMAALPDTPARLSRATALRKAFDAFRSYYPPQLAIDAALPTPNPNTDVEKAPVWREERLLLWQAGIQNNSGTTVAYPWLPVGLQLWTSPLLEPSTATSQPHHAAATLLPARLSLDGQDNPTPVSFAVSPYLGLSRHPAPADVELFLASLELLGLDSSTNQLRPIASLLREENSPETLETFARNWGYETRRRERPNSPLGIVRRRQLKKMPMDAEAVEPAATESELLVNPALLIATYGFSLVEEAQGGGILTKRVVALRSQIQELRFREGQYGGIIMPTSLQPYEVAPPLTNGVQPIYTTPLTSIEEIELDDLEVGEIEVDDVPRVRPDWRWGISALTVGVQYTSAQAEAGSNAAPIGVTGRVPGAPELPATLWWHAPQHHVQFRSTLSDVGATAGLPPLFRAKAINSLLPTLPQVAFPTAGALQASAGKKEDRAPTDSLIHWQPALPGSLSYLLVGARSGAMLAIRNQLLRQQGLLFSDDGAEVEEMTIIDTLISGSVPVQHRVPRPVPLPANEEDEQDSALQTWASYVTPTQRLETLTSPVDEAFFAECGEEPDRTPIRRLRAELVWPPRGEINAQWDGRVEFLFRNEENEVTESGWFARVELGDGDLKIPLITSNSTDDPETAFGTEWSPESVNERNAIRALIGNRQVGQTILLQAHVKPATATSNFRQSLTFPLRIVDDRQLRLPLEPRFTLFEDPEYNRRLASLAGRFAMPVQVKQTSADKEIELVLQSVSISTDRREYNPESIVWIRYDWDNQEMQEDATNLGVLSFQKVDKSNNPFDLTLPDVSKQVVVETGNTQLFRLDLAQLQPNDPDDPNGIFPGDSLIIQLDLFTPNSESPDKVENATISNLVKDETIKLEVDIVAEPVIPLPDAAYGLLRSQIVDSRQEVECVRFAWGPNAGRFELICPDDLLQEVVRRRAVFKWTDSARPATDDSQGAHYQIQKIAENGATHFPLFRELEPTP